MPYIPGTGRLTDVYHSPNVFANNVQVALWLEAGQWDAFAGVSISPVITIDQVIQDQIDADNTAYTTAQAANPGQPNQYYNAAAAEGGVKGNYPGTPDDATTSTGTIATDASFSDIVPFLSQCLEQTKANGYWRETGQGGKPSNTHITDIWKNLGYPASGAWLSDQTAWCMGFVNFALKSSGYRYVQTAAAAAITTNPERWGAVQVPKDQAQPGDIAFWSYRHVNFVYQKTGPGFNFVGGNQTPKGGSNNPDDGDVTISWPGGISPSNSSWVSCWRPSKT